MTNFTSAGKIGWLSLLKNANLFMAWGSGNPAWDVGLAPTFPDTQSALLAELGRQKITNKQWVLPNPTGSILVNGVKYNPSVTPTDYLYVSATFAQTVEPTASIREKALFVNSVVNPALASTPGKVYFKPSEVTDPGTLLLGQNFAKIVRSPAIAENFFFIVQL